MVNCRQDSAEGVCGVADVFISYSKGSTKLVKQIVSTLEEAGISCWYMGRDSRHGRFPERIAREIEDCTIFLLVLNEESNRSRYVQNEVSLAFEHELEILPFHVDSCKLSHYMSFYLNSVTIINANPPNEQHITELVEEIVDILGKESSQRQSGTEYDTFI